EEPAAGAAGDREADEDGDAFESGLAGEGDKVALGARELRKRLAQRPLDRFETAFGAQRLEQGGATDGREGSGADRQRRLLGLVLTVDDDVGEPGRDGRGGGDPQRFGDRLRAV